MSITYFLQVTTGLLYVMTSTGAAMKKSESSMSQRNSECFKETLKDSIIVIELTHLIFF